MTPEAQRQKRYRQRQADERIRLTAYVESLTADSDRMETALREIASKTDGKTGPVAVEIRKLALDALGETA